MTQISPYVHFDGNCREAMTFYCECLGGELSMQTVAGSPIAAQCSPQMQHQILHASLANQSLVLMGSDMIGPDGYHQGNNIALSLSCSSEEEINKYFSTLSEGGMVIHELSTAFWGATFGVFNDKYGIRWMLNYDKNIQQ